jgi:hypothetical protein
MAPTIGLAIVATGALCIAVDVSQLFTEACSGGDPPRFDRRAMLFALLFGLMLMMGGQLAFEAAYSRDQTVFCIVGWYVLGAAVALALGGRPMAFVLALDSVLALDAGYAPAYDTPAFWSLQILPFTVLALPLLLRSVRTVLGSA